MADGLKVLIVDDEPLARADLNYMLKSQAAVQTVIECGNATEALDQMREDVFDVIFLDIEMPGLNGLKAVQIINQLRNPPLIVFVTAYDEHAVKAFELNAVDYLVKPFSAKRLEQAVQKVTAVRAVIASKPANGGNLVATPNAGTLPTDPQFKKIPVEKGGGVMLISLPDVRYISAYDDKVYIHTLEDKFLCRFSLTELEIKLATQGFARIHRSYLVNLQHVLELQPFFNGTYNLIVDDKPKSVLPVSRARVKSLRSLIGV
jgi:DNA-binding LytR/AlgR family response regulator